MMTNRIPDAKRTVCTAYLYAKKSIIEKGFDWELERYWRRVERHPSIGEILEEMAWVILSAGFNERVLCNVFPRIAEAFYHWSSIERIVRNRQLRVERSLSVFNYREKVEAIAETANMLRSVRPEELYNRMRNDIRGLQEFPFIGPVTQYHLAKNLGLPVAKPDRHLRRICEAFEYSCPQNLCTDVMKYIGDPVSVVDTVFWRYATLQKNYVSLLREVASAPNME